MRTAVGVVWALALASISAGAAFAQTDARPALESRGVFVEYDAGGGTITLRERGRLQAYALLEGGEAGETEVSIESEAARVSDLEAGAPAIVTWRPDAEERARRIATRIEVPRIPKSFREDLR